MNTKESRLIRQIYKIGMIILIITITLLFIGIILGSHIVDLMFNMNFIPLGYTREEILSYYGVVITGIITMIALVVTIKSNSKDRKKQFYFEVKHRHIINTENQIKEAILYFCSVNDRILHIFDDDIINKNLDDFKCDNIDTYFYLDFFKHSQKLSNIIRELKMKIECVYLYFPILIKNSESKKSYFNLVNESYKKIDLILRNMYSDMYNLLNKFKSNIRSEKLSSDTQEKQFFQRCIKFKNSIRENYSDKINEIINNEVVHIRDNFFNYFESLNQSYIDEIENKY